MDWSFPIMEIDSIEQLNANKEAFDGQIIGIDSGAGIMRATERAIPNMAWNMNWLPAAVGVTAALGKAIDNKESIVVTGWTPHWKFARWDLKFLEDPKTFTAPLKTFTPLPEKDFPKICRGSRIFRNMGLQTISWAA